MLMINGVDVFLILGLGIPTENTNRMPGSMPVVEEDQRWKTQ